jgi:Flp pilus assembly protein TadB
VGRLSDRLGELDDNSVIYRANDPEQKVNWSRLGLVWAIGKVVALLLLGGVGVLVGELAGAITLFVLTVTFLVFYVIWRRRRNKRLTGSPTTWPSAGSE